jgi:plasmid stability protein
MFNITIRNIPDDIMEKIRILSETERRSLNNEILILLERGVLLEMKTRKTDAIPASVQVKIWEKLAGMWEDDRNTGEIINDIYSARSQGREVEL